MRKYQQLALLLISGFSVGILLMYKSENNRLLHVLRVVNFFGRSDVAVLRRLDNGTKDFIGAPEFSKPLPVWQMIGDSFHAYAAYWSRNELVAGGEAQAFVVGRRGAVINFHCNLTYDHGTRSVQGKFRFQRGLNETLVDNKSKENTFTAYNFFCRVTRDFGQPESVSFTDHTTTTTTGNRLRLRYLKPITKARSPPVQITACVDLVSFNSSTRFAEKEENLLQFFLFHQASGIDHFIVYDSDELPSRVVQLLQRTNLHLYQMPFNFPFAFAQQKNNSSTLRLRQLIESDCLLRNLNQAEYTLLLSPNEFFFLNAKDTSDHAIKQSLSLYKGSGTRYMLTSVPVCLDDRHKLLLDNSQYDAEPPASQKVFLYSLHGSTTAQLLGAENNGGSLSMSSGFVHRYTDCQRVGPDGLHDWRSSVRDDFMARIQTLRSEIDLLI